MQSHEEREAAFVRYLGGLTEPENRNGRATLAAFRRGLGRQPGEAPEMYPYLVPWTSHMSGWREEIFYLVASLFASHPVSWHGVGAGNFGASMAQVKAKEGGDSTQRRFVALLSSHRADLPEHLRHAVSLCASKEVAVNWSRLLRDLPQWDDAQRRVQLRWARAFWQRVEEPALPA
jgi:CRISPR system Cascade subunit CasB